MAHGIDMTNGRANMAYVGDTPWHGLGSNLTEGASIETWAKEAGMSYEILPGTLHFQVGKKMYDLPSKQALYRNDTMQPVGVVGNRYQVVQPAEILEFFRDLTEERGFILETAGVLFNGSRYWALARTPHSLMLPGKDEVKEHLMLATACDGSMATTAKYVRTRVVCNNTLQASLGENGVAVRVEHRSKFNEKNVKKELGLVEASWETFTEQAKLLAKTTVSNEDAAQYFINLFGNPELTLEDQTAPTVEELYTRFTTQDFLGAQLKAAKGTLWGLVNTTTEHVDWHMGNIQDRRLKAAWFGKNVGLKQQAFDEALKLAA